VLALVLFFAELTEKGLDLFNRLSTDRAGVDQDKVRIGKSIDERVADARELGLNGVRIVFVHLTAERDYVCSHWMPGPKNNIAE
jgi:hypothetical protein